MTSAKNFNVTVRPTYTLQKKMH